MIKAIEKLSDREKLIINLRFGLNSKDGEEMTADEMKDYIKAHMAKHKCPRYIDFVKEFPMNAAGKILKYKMREDAAKKLNIKKVEGIVAD